jgi:F0F1-type ATP synthase assembly protein I
VETDQAVGIAGLQEALTRANGFLSAALPANRDGRLTAAQSQALLREQSRTRRLFVVSGLVVAGIAGIALTAQIAQSGLSAALGGDATWLVFAVGLILLAVGLFWRMHEADITEGTVSAVEGTGRKMISSNEDGADTYYYRIRDKQFEVGHDGYEALLEGARYRAYYAPHSGAIVNIEVLSLPQTYGPAPVCPLCGRDDRVHYPMVDPGSLEEIGARLGRFLPLGALFGARSVSAQQAETLGQQIQMTLTRLPVLASCQRDQVVFVPGTGKTVRLTDFIRMVVRAEDTEALARALGV